MELQEQRIGDRLLLSASGRLDATWADFFKEALLTHIRAGEHQIVVNAAKLTFLSSLGIRAMMVVYKKLTAVSGSFQIIHAEGMVKDTLNASGLGIWLSDEALEIAPEDAPSAEYRTVEYFELEAAAALRVEKINAWAPWAPIQENQCAGIRFNVNSFGLGIGAAGASMQQARNYLGEFVAAGGQVAIQPPDEYGRPDCLLTEQAFIPELYSIQSWIARGNMAGIIRFRSGPDTPVFNLSTLISEAALKIKEESFGIAIIGEIEGLVGAQLIRSPGKLTDRAELSSTDMKDWLSFCGERSFNRELAVVTGVVTRSLSDEWNGLSPLTESRDLYGHFHAAVFPYQFLPNGPLSFPETARQIFEGPPPKAVMHLISDERPGIGIGESALYHGACWFAPISGCEVIS
jgi:anti-anti-sigma factor